MPTGCTTRRRADVYARSHGARARGVWRASGARGHGSRGARRPAADRRDVPCARRHLVGGVLDGRRRGAARVRTSRSSTWDSTRRAPAIIDVLERMGARHQDRDRARAGGRTDWHAFTCVMRDLRPAEITPDEVPGVIDELPVLAALATHGGELSVSGAQELRVKESDRISALADGLRLMGGDDRRARRRLFTCAGATGCAEARSTPKTIIDSPWRSRSRRSAPRGRRSSTTRARPACPTLSSLPCSSRCAREDR